MQSHATDRPSRRMNITVLGAGAWGSAMAMTLAARHDVLLWGRDAAAMNELAMRRENRPYLPGFALPDALRVSADFDAAINQVASEASRSGSLLIAACPVAGLRPLAQRLQGTAIANLVWLCKGFEENSRLLPHQVVHEVLGAAVAGGALSGPSFAQEVAAGLPCALTLAAESAALRERGVAAVHGGSPRIYSTHDVGGVEGGGAGTHIPANPNRGAAGP